MKKELVCAALVLLAVLVPYSAVMSQPYPSLFVCNFHGAVTANGAPLSVGSILRAYDPQSVLIGVCTTRFAGIYGNFPTYGDESGTTGLDEGAVNGDTVRFTINGRAATHTGDPVWVNMDTKALDLASNSTVALSMVDPPNDTLVTINRTIKLRIGIHNDGNGLDFYRVTATNSDTAFHTTYEDSFVYADSNATVYVTFDILTPTFVTGLDTVDVVDFKVYSQVDTMQTVSGTVNVILSLTDIPDHGRNLPEGFALYQNYPNPFNPSTIISYSLPSRSNVQLQVIDLLGRIALDRDLGHQSAGSHEFEFNASGLASGVYFYRIQTEFGAKSRKMMLLK